MSAPKYGAEYKTKTLMAKRLNLLMKMEPSLVLHLVSTYHVISNEVGHKTNFVTEAPSANNPEALINLMGILNGVVGDSQWVIFLDTSGDIPTFKVKPVSKQTYLKLNYSEVKQEPYKLNNDKSGE